jgi:hypothetical protein
LMIVQDLSHMMNLNGIKIITLIHCAIIEICEVFSLLTT